MVVDDEVITEHRPRRLVAREAHEVGAQVHVVGRALEPADLPAVRSIHVHPLVGLAGDARLGVRGRQAVAYRWLDRPALAAEQEAIREVARALGRLCRRATVVAEEAMADGQSMATRLRAALGAL